MNKNLIEFKNHFDDKTTLVFQYNDEKYIINGCQIFLEKEKDVVFKCFNVGESYKNDVIETLTLLNGNVNENDLLYIVETYPNFIGYIKKEHQTYEMALTAVKNKSYILQYIREDLQTYEMALMVVKDWGRNIKYVRKDLQDYEMALIAIKDWSGNLQYVREDLQDYEMALMLLKNGV